MAYNATWPGCRGKENQDQEKTKKAKFPNLSIFVGLISIVLECHKSKSKIIHHEHVAYNARGKGCRGKENQDQEEAKQAKFPNSSIFVGLISNFFEMSQIKR